MLGWIIVALVAVSALWGLWGLVRRERVRRIVEDAILKHRLAEVKYSAQVALDEDAAGKRRTLH